MKHTFDKQEPNTGGQKKKPKGNWSCLFLFSYWEPFPNKSKIFYLFIFFFLKEGGSFLFLKEISDLENT